MKIALLKRNIYINLVIALSLMFCFIASYIGLKMQFNQLDKEISDTDSSITAINGKITSTKKKAEDLKRYLVLWNKLPKHKKKFTVFKAEDFNTIIDKLAQKHLLKVSQMTVPLPESLKLESDGLGVFINISHTEVTINFSTYIDSNVFNFVDELENQLPGFVVFKSIEIKKSREYKEDDFMKIANNEEPEAIFTGSIKFFWYIYRNKE